MVLTIEGFLKGTWHMLVSYNSGSGENPVRYAKMESMVDELQGVIKASYSKGTPAHISVNDTIINVLSFDAMRVKLNK